MLFRRPKFNAPREPDGWLRPSLLVLSALLLSLAINVEEGMYHPRAVMLLAGAIVICLAAVATPSHPALKQWQARMPGVLLGLAILVQFHTLFWGRPGTWKNVDWRQPATAVGPLSMTGKLPWPNVVQELTAERQKLADALPGKGPTEAGELLHRILAIDAHLNVTGLQFFILLLAALAILMMLSRGRVKWLMPAFLAVSLTMGCWVVWRTPRPHIDVFIFQQEASKALLNGQNPYAIDFPNIYGPGNYVYAPALEEGDRVNFGFPYTPAGLYMAAGGYAVAGDHRYAQVVALTLAAALLAYSQTGIIAKLAAILLLSTPRIVMVIECAWTEPFIVLGLAAVVFAACRAPRFAPWLFGFFVAIKQYLIFAVPLALLLLPRPSSLRQVFLFLIKGGLVALLLSAPLVFWDLPAFWFSAGTLQFKQPFRPDSLSFPALIAQSANPQLAQRLAALAFLLVIPSIVLAIWRLPRTAAGFASGIALVFFVFFSMNKQAFCNYHFFTFAALCSAIAASAAIAPQASAEEAEAAAELAAMNATAGADDAAAPPTPVPEAPFPPAPEPSA